MNFVRKSPYRTFGVLFGTIVLLLVAVGYSYGQFDPLIGYLLAVNIATTGAYGYDKKISASSRVRVPENVLHVLALVGGSPGAFVAQQLFRHKTRKSSFQLVFWGIVLLQAIVVVWLWR